MELKITTDITASVPTEIEWNFEQLKSELTTKLEYYDNLVVTEESIKSAKSDKAKLTKLLKNINDERLLREREYMKPFDKFKFEVKEISTMIADSSSKIDVQLKAFDDKEKSQKLATLTEFYAEHTGDLLQLLPLEKIINPKWANKSESIISLEFEIEERISKVRQDLAAITAMKSEFEVQIKNAYLKNINMSDALLEKSKLDELKALEERRKQVQQKMQTPEETRKQVQQEMKTTQSPEEPRDIKVVFYDTTAAFRTEMKLLTQKYNIKYGGIK